MPLYEYQCPVCENIELIKIDIKNLSTTKVLCKKCKCIMQRLFSSTNFILKGSRWAKDGYTGG